ncbi:MAG TPA: TIGR01777 family oxidoreductase [Vicinamibacterales bacterium]
MTIVLAGGSGFLGRKLAKRLEQEGHKTITLTRRPSGAPNQIGWRPDGTAGDLAPHLDGVDAVVNLAGEGIADKRWTEARKRALRDSRILSTRTLVRAIRECATPPRVLVSGSGIGYYGPHGDEPVTEATPPGTDFLARLCVEWEEEARAAESPSTRVAIVRTGLALDGDGGALKKMLLPFKLGAGATIASGNQYMPWIHASDWTAMVAWLIHNNDARGAFNASAPEPVTNREFTRTLARVLHRPAVFQAPAFVLRAALGELATALIDGQRVLPGRAGQLGFRFSYPSLQPALESMHL